MESRKLDKNTWLIEDKSRVSYLLEGEESAILLDGLSGCEGSFLQNLTEKPISLINTASLEENLCLNDSFPVFYMSPSDGFLYYKTLRKVGIMKPLFNGKVIDLGGRRIEIVSFPGVTPGSVVLIDYNLGAVFSGHSIVGGTIDLSFPFSDIHAYLESIYYLSHYKNKFDVIYPGLSSPLSPSILDTLENIIRKIIRKEETGKITERGTLFDGGLVTLLLETKDE